MPLDKVQRDLVNRHRVVTAELAVGTPTPDLARWTRLWSEQIDLQYRMNAEAWEVAGLVTHLGIFK